MAGAGTCGTSGERTVTGGHGKFTVAETFYRKGATLVFSELRIRLSARFQQSQRPPRGLQISGGNVRSVLHSAGKL